MFEWHISKIPVFMASVGLLYPVAGCWIENAINNYRESECQTDAQCDDGVFCNGSEVCATTCRDPLLFFCLAAGPKECRSANNNSSHPCCIVAGGPEAGDPLTSACESACHEADNTCDIGNECVTDRDCKDADCKERDFCENGFCFAGPFAIDIQSGPRNLQQCRNDCTAAGFPRVADFSPPDSPRKTVCICILEEDTLCPYHESYEIENPKMDECAAVCEQAGWPETQGPGHFPDSCLCGILDFVATNDVASCMRGCGDNRFLDQFYPHIVCGCADGTEVRSGEIYDEEGVGCEVICHQLGWPAVDLTYGDSFASDGKGNCRCLGPIIAAESQP